MKKINYILIFVFAFTFFRCKKSSSTSSTPSAGSGNNNNSASYYGFLGAHFSQSASSGSLTPVFAYSSAYFSSAATSIVDYAHPATVTDVSLNGVLFKYTAWAHDYEDTTNSTPSVPTSWVINGLGSIPSFTYANNNPIPTFTAAVSLPDTIFKTKTNTLNMTGITGTDITSISLSDSAYHNVLSNLSAGATSYQFTSSDMAYLSACKTAHISISCIKNNVQSFGGKSFNFTLEYSVNKNVVIK